MAIRPRQVISTPSFTPTPYGLLSVVDAPPVADHWQNGVTWQSPCVTGAGVTYDECLVVTGAGSPASPPPATKGVTVDLTTRGATPFAVYSRFDCSTVGNTDARAIAERALGQNGSWQVERAFWTGQIQGQNVVWPRLTGTTTVLDEGGILLGSVAVTGGSATTDVADGLGFLEAQLADCYNGVGVIHVPVEAIPTLDAWNLIKVRGAALTTLNGNRVAVGAGYPGTAPDGSAPAAGTTWLYATGPVFAFQGPAKVLDGPGSIDRAENTIEMIAERTYVLGFDCCHAGVLVQLGVPVT